MSFLGGWTGKMTKIEKVRAGLMSHSGSCGGHIYISSATRKPKCLRCGKFVLIKDMVGRND